MPVQLTIKVRGDLIIHDPAWGRRSLGALSMTVWIERTSAIDRWFHVQDLFEEHFSALEGPRDMI